MFSHYSWFNKYLLNTYFAVLVTGDSVEIETKSLSSRTLPSPGKCRKSTRENHIIVVCSWVFITLFCSISIRYYVSVNHSGEKSIHVNGIDSNMGRRNGGRKRQFLTK